MRLLPVFAAVSTLFIPGCMLFFDDGGSRPDKCDLATSGQGETRGPSGIAPAPLRDPERLTCEAFGPSCDPECGPCPETAALAPIPTWGLCGSSCESLDESSCAASSECRVVRDARCAVMGNCLTDFMGCFPLDNTRDPAVDCFTARDGWTCSRSAACSALHEQTACTTDAECPRSFALCVPEGENPGKCHEPAICASPGPSCPSGTIAGVANGCFTGACIPLGLCEPIP